MVTKLEFTVLEWIPEANTWKFGERLSYTTDDQKKATLRINKIKKILQGKEGGK